MILRPVAPSRAHRLFQLLLLATSTWAVTYARFALSPLQETMRVDLTLSDNQIAWLQGPAVAIPMALGAIPLGLLVDRYSRVRIFLLFVVLNLVAAIVTSFASSMPALFLARGLAGLANSAILVVAYAMIGDIFAPEHRGRATTAVAMGEVSGAPVAFALGGVLLAASEGGVGGWRTTLLWMCVPLVPTLLMMFTLREPPRGESSPQVALGAVWMELWRYRSAVVPLMLARIMVWIASGAVLVWAAPTFSRSFALPPERIGGIIGVALLISGVLGPLFGGPLADFCQSTGGPRRTLGALAVLALLSVPAALFPVMPSATSASFVLVVFLMLGFVIGTAAMALTTIVIPAGLRGLLVAITVTVGAVFCDGLAPLTVSALSGALGGPAMIGRALAIVCVLTSMLGAVVFAIGTRYFPRVRVQHLVPRSVGSG